MSETSASKSPFDPEKFCECQKCFSIHVRGSKAEELKIPTIVVDAEKCKYCSGTGFVDHVVDGVRFGVKKCNHQPPQGELPI